MKSYTYWINGAVILGVAGMLAVNYGVAGQRLDRTTTASIPAIAADHFMVVDHAHNRTCILALHRAEGYDVHRVEPGQCDGMPKAVAMARTWQDIDNGHVRITDRKGNVVMRLQAADRYGWNVTEPASLSVSFEAF